MPTVDLSVLGLKPSAIEKIYKQSQTSLSHPHRDAIEQTSRRRRQGEIWRTGMQITGYFYLLYIVMIVFSVLGYHVYGETSTLGYPLAGLSDAFYCLWVISFVVAIGYLRYVIRHKYEIPAQCCTCDQDGVVDDCCCAFWCGCCATAQIARHEYAIPATGTVKYDCCSATGEP